MGEQEVKNIEKPVRVYRVLMEPEQAGKVIGEKGLKRTQWRWAVAAAVILVAGAFALWSFYFRPPPIEPASKEKMAFPLPDKPSIAVLPFVNMSDDKSQEYFSDGLTEEIINALVKLPQVFVIARNSSFTYKGKSVDVRQVGREMGVKYVLEGSVRREGERMRVTAQLVDTTTGNHLFSERYDREVKDLFALQDDITMKVMMAMRVQLTEGDYARASAKGTKNLEANLKAMQSYQQRQVLTKEGQARARQLAEKALALDPGYAMAYCHLAAALGNEATMGVYKNVPEILARSMELAQKAVALDDSLAQAHVTLGFQYTLRRNSDLAIAEGERAVALEPNSAEIVASLAAMLEWADRPEETIPLLKKAMRLSPIPQPMWLLNMASAHIRMGQYEESIPICKTVLQKQPDQVFAQIFLAIAYISTGREQEARAEATEILRVNPQFSWERLARGLPRKNQDEMKRRGELLRKAGLSE
jgi:adenylate cyclase